MSSAAPHPVRLAPVVAVINLKGGVGKTTVVGNVFPELHRLARVRTLIVDFDPQYNLSQLILTRAAYEVSQGAGRSIYSVLEPSAAESVFAVDGTSAYSNPSEEDVSVVVKKLPPPYETAEYRLIPGDFRLTEFNLRESSDSLAGPRKRFANFIQGARSSFGLVVIDCNPSSSFLTRSAIEVATHLLVPVRPERYSLLGVEMLSNYIASFPVTTPHKIHLLLNGVSTGIVSPEESQLRSHASFGPMTLFHRMPDSKFLQARSASSKRKGAAWQRLKSNLSAVANEIAGKVGLL